MFTHCSFECLSATFIRAVHQRLIALFWEMSRQQDFISHLSVKFVTILRRATFKNSIIEVLSHNTVKRTGSDLVLAKGTISLASREPLIDAVLAEHLITAIALHWVIAQSNANVALEVGWGLSCRLICGKLKTTLQMSLRRL